MINAGNMSILARCYYSNIIVHHFCGFSICYDVVISNVIDEPGFYPRGILCVSAFFAVVRCPSVRPSDRLADCIHTAEDVVKLFVRPGSPIILVFGPHVPISNSKGNPFS